MLKLLCAPILEQSGSATVHSLLEFAYRKEYGDALPDIKKTSAGKPFFPDRPDVHFSLSHAHTHVLCGISSEPIGVDIESPRKISEKAISFFSYPEELDFFDPLDLWVLKESYIKLIGGRLMLVKSIRFSYENGAIVTTDRLAFSRLYHVDGCRAAASTYGDHLPDSIELI